MANKLELTWVGKDEEIKLEPRILIENPTLSNIEKDKDTENMLIHGDNLLALKALESKYAGESSVFIQIRRIIQEMLLNITMMAQSIAFGLA